MRIYKILTSESIYLVQCDEILFKDDFRNQTKNQALCLFQGKRLIAIFKEWMMFLDVTDVTEAKLEEK